MKVLVKPLRSRGARLSDYQIQAAIPTEGVLRLYGLGASIQISVNAPDDQQGTPLLPDLYDARLISLHGNKMLFSGIERTGDPLAAQYLQEWSLVVESL